MSFSGSSFTDLLSMTAPNCVLVVSTSGASDVTSTIFLGFANLHRGIAVSLPGSVQRDSFLHVRLESREDRTTGVSADRHFGKNIIAAGIGDVSG